MSAEQQPIIDYKAKYEALKAYVTQLLAELDDMGLNLQVGSRTGKARINHIDSNINH